MKNKILIFSIAYHPFIGGAEVAVQEICKRLSGFDFNIITLRMDRALPKIEKIKNITIHRIGFAAKKEGIFIRSSVNWPLTVSKYLFPFLAFLKARSLNRKERFDLTWSIMANYAGFAALFFKWFYPKIPFLLTLQEGDDLEYIKKRVGIFMPLFRQIFHKADKIQAISNFLAEFGKSMGHKGQPIVIPNGVDISNFSRVISEEELKEAREILGKQPGDFFIITSSRLVKKNAVDIVIKSLTFLPKNYKFFVAGTGQESDELERLVGSLGLAQRVKFGGFIEHKKLPTLLKTSDCFVRPSRSEGMGNSFIEAMAAGLPVVATPVGGIVDFLEDGVTGLFCKVDDPDDIAKQVKRLIEDDKLRENIVKNARKNVQKSYDWDNISQRMKKEVFNDIQT